MSQGENSLVLRNQQSTFQATPHGVLANPAFKQLPRRDNPVLNLSEGANGGGRVPISHTDSHRRRSASNFLPPSPEI
jgi:hypothetical protein